ncbi:hypothetical protein CHARACLAT_031658 [Characodon lateralis]|uniref:Uncharacterized protein n=1 Tax=Characodon lateralis TaxID=208331 RepID=A0ABU7EPI9_9TELE|nr:hypothetical protein [Characodon lateralis]
MSAVGISNISAAASSHRAQRGPSALILTCLRFALQLHGNAGHECRQRRTPTAGKGKRRSGLILQRNKDRCSEAFSNKRKIQEGRASAHRLMDLQGRHGDMGCLNVWKCEEHLR